MWGAQGVLYLMVLGLSVFITLSGTSWFVVWVGLEISMLSFVPLINGRSKLKSEAIFKYFLVQAVGSILLLYIGLFSLLRAEGGDFIVAVFSAGALVLMVLVLKLGASPFHFWLPVVMGGLDWAGVLILTTWQKVGPLALMSLLCCNSVLMMVVGLMSVFVGGVGGISQLLLRSIFAYSSISHLGWLCLLLGQSEEIGLIYFLFYCLVVGAVLSCLVGTCWSHISQVNMLQTSAWGFVWVFYLGLFSLGGLPPMCGFFPKWAGLLFLMVNGWWLVCLFVMGISLFSLYYYLRMGYASLLMGSVVGLWGGSLMQTGVWCMMLNICSFLLLPHILFLLV